MSVILKHLMFKTIFLIFISVLIFLFSFSFVCNSVGVQPLVIDLNMQSGETKEFQLKLSPQENQQIVELKFYYPRQQLTGSLSYEEGNLEEHEVLKWLELPQEVTVPPAEKTTVNVEVSVPFDAEGTHTAIIMVEPVVEAETGVTFKVRYAVRINIHIDAPGLRESAELLDFSLEKNEEDRPVIKTRLHNDSALMYDAAGEVTIRDESRQLVERIPVKSRHAAQAGRDHTTIYPGAEVIFQGPVTEPLHAGTYDLQLFLYYGDGQQIIERKTIEIGDEFIDPETMEYIEVTPEAILDNLRPGGAATESLGIRNRTGEPLYIQLQNKEIEPEYSRSIFENLEVQLRGDQVFRLQGRRSQNTVLISRSPRDIEPGGYYGTININVFNQEEEHLETRTVDLDMIIGQDHQYQAEVLDLTVDTVEAETVFSTLITNNSPVHIRPTARIYLKDETDEIIQTITTRMPDQDDRILPEMTGRLENYLEDVEPGSYTAEVTVNYQDQEIGYGEFPVEIKMLDDTEEIEGGS